MDTIATISLARPRAEIADDLGRSFAEYGFAIVRDHTISQELTDRADALARQFFAPAEAKGEYRIEGAGGARGYTPFGTEIAKDAKVHDLKEFWDIGRGLAKGHLPPGALAVNVGDMLDRLTNAKLRSPTRRVVNPSCDARLREIGLA